MIDLIIEIIRGSKSQKEVKACLTKGDVGNIHFQSSDSMIEATKLSFTDKQASAILDLKLYRLIGLEILMLKEEYEEILVKIEEYEDILNNEKSLKNVIRKELDKIKKEFGTRKKNCGRRRKRGSLCCGTGQRRDSLFCDGSFWIFQDNG